MKKKLIAIFGSMVFSIAGFGVVTSITVATSFVTMHDAIADNVSCTTNSWGTTNCSGPGGTTSCSTNSWGTTNCSGAGGSTSCSTNSWGTTNCSGAGGSTSCSTNSWGTTNCSGAGGSTSCSTNSWGTSNCSGTNGSYSCSTNSWGTTNCSGSGIKIIPTPTPTPTKTYVYTNPTPTPTKTYVYTNPTPTPTPTKTYVYTNPTPSVSAKAVSIKKACVTSLGLPESCKNYPDFFIEYCSQSSGGTLQWISGKTWIKLWEIVGTKTSRCPSGSNPYLNVIQGQLQSVSGISLRVVNKAVNGSVPSPDLFTVKIK